MRLTWLVLAFFGGCRPEPFAGVEIVGDQCLTEGGSRRLVFSFRASSVDRVVRTLWSVQGGKAEARANSMPSLKNGEGAIEVLLPSIEAAKAAEVVQLYFGEKVTLGKAGDRWGSCTAAAGLKVPGKGQEVLLHLDGWTGDTPLPRPSVSNDFDVNVRSTANTDIRFAALTLRCE